MASHVKQLLSYIRWTRLHEDISHWDYMVFTPCQLRIKDSQIQFEKLILGITITWNLVLYSQHPVPLIPTLPSPLALSLSSNILPSGFTFHYTPYLTPYSLYFIALSCLNLIYGFLSPATISLKKDSDPKYHLSMPCRDTAWPFSYSRTLCFLFVSDFPFFHGHPGRKAFDTKTMILTFVSLRHWLGQGLLPGTGC